MKPVEARAISSVLLYHSLAENRGLLQTDQTDKWDSAALKAMMAIITSVGIRGQHAVIAYARIATYPPGDYNFLQEFQKVKDDYPDSSS